MNGVEKIGGLINTGTVDADINERLQEFVKDKEAFSASTWRQLLSVMRQCLKWANANGRTFLPLSAPDLRDYIQSLQDRGLASSTIASHVALISMLHRNAGLIPPNASASVSRAMKKVNRMAVVSGERVGQAVPFHRTDLLALDEIWQNSDRKQDIRNLAFLHVAYSTLLRIAELSRLRVRDIQRAPDGRIILDVGYTKTIVNTGGLVKSLSTISSQRLTEWIDAAGLAAEPDAFIFCRVHRSNKATISTSKPMSPEAIETIFHNAWLVAGNSANIRANKDRYTGWSGHSARVGAAQDMAAAGYTVPQIMQEGTWKKTETLMGYIRHIEAQKGAMINLMEGD